MQIVNPNLQKNIAEIYSKSIDQDEVIRLTNLINTGIEGYAKTSEADLEKIVKIYIKEQDKLSIPNKVSK